MPASLPPDEELRLLTLARYDVLDTPPDAALDRLTALAARLFRVPIALVSLVDKDRQWFKSRHGVDVCDTHRDHSFCAYVILPEAEEMMVVPDALLDPRFADNPLVTGQPGIRFYAGTPLRMSNGTALGSFCVIDTQPREFPRRSAPRWPTWPPPPWPIWSCTPPGAWRARKPLNAAWPRTPCARASSACATWPRTPRA